MPVRLSRRSLEWSHTLQCRRSASLSFWNSPCSVSSSLCCGWLLSTVSESASSSPPYSGKTLFENLTLHLTPFLASFTNWSLSQRLILMQVFLQSIHGDSTATWTGSGMGLRVWCSSQRVLSPSYDSSFLPVAIFERCVLNYVVVLIRKSNKWFEIYVFQLLFWSIHTLRFLLDFLEIRSGWLLWVTTFTSPSSDTVVSIFKKHFFSLFVTAITLPVKSSYIALVL